MMIDETIELLKVLHDGQHDWVGEPYWKHPVQVMETLRPDATDEDRIIALLHDVPEDCSGKDWAVAKGLIAGYSNYIQRGVLLLTRINGEFLHHETMQPVIGSYMNYVRNIVASQHFGALIVKLSDNLQNSSPERIALIPDAEKKATAMGMASDRYKRARAILEEELSHWEGRARK